MACSASPQSGGGEPRHEHDLHAVHPELVGYVSQPFAAHAFAPLIGCSARSARFSRWSREAPSVVESQLGEVAPDIDPRRPQPARVRLVWVRLQHHAHALVGVRLVTEVGLSAVVYPGGWVVREDAVMGMAFLVRLFPRPHQVLSTPGGAACRTSGTHGRS